MKTQKVCEDSCKIALSDGSPAEIKRLLKEAKWRNIEKGKLPNITNLNSLQLKKIVMFQNEIIKMNQLGG